MKILKTFKFKKILTIIILSIILIGGFAVRLYKINSPIADWHSWRQADTASVARIYSDRGIDLLHPRYYDVSSIQTGYYNGDGLRYVEFPVYNVAHVVLYKLIPNLGFEVAGRLITIFSSLTTAFLIYLLCKRYINKTAAFFGAFFFAFLPFNIFFSRVILPEEMAVMFAIASVYIFSIFTQKEKNLYLFLSAISFSLAILVDPYVAFYSIPIIYLALKKYGLKSFFKVTFYLALDLALVPLFLWRAYFFEKVVGIPPVEWAFNGDGIRFRPAFWWWIFGQRLGSLILGIWGTALFVLGFAKNDKKNLFVESMALGAFIFVSVVATANVRHDYYQSMIIPAVVFVLAKGTSYVWNLGKIRPKLVIFASIFLMLLIGAYQVKEYYKINHPEFMLAGAYIDKIAPKDAKVIAPNNGDTAFLYQTKRFGWPVLDRSIDETITLGAKYYVSVTFNDTDTVNFKKRFKTIEENQQFIVLDLTKEISKKK
ncbi:MAG: glycosyltransferase family 39 protein [Candidatus Woesebacteria bacterium]|nr:MAG: glycosyltransferase family 39 protein [Candidatus Woesebacteria bacterium]